MEDWQGRVIQKNFPKLVEKTKCTTAFLAMLLDKELITYEEREQIDGVLDPLLKAEFLYKFIQTRKTAYREFLKACVDVKQSQVVYILETGELDLKLSEGLHECNISEFSSLSRENLSTITFESISKAIAAYCEVRKFKAAFKGYSFCGFRPKPKMKPWLLKGPNDETFLHIAAAYGYVELIDYLIELGLKASEIDTYGRTAGHYIGKFSTNIVKTSGVLIQHGLNVRQVDSRGWTIASTVVSYRKINQYHYHHWVEYMIKNGFEDVFTQNSKRDSSPLHHVMEVLDLERITIKLFKRSTKININHTDKRGLTVLHWGLRFGRDLKTIKSLIEFGGDYNLKDNNKGGALHLAVRGGNKEVISFLLSLKLNVNEVDDYDETPMHKVRFRKSRDYLGMTKHLLDKGGDLYAKDKYGNTIAHLLACNENISLNDFWIWVEGVINIGHSHVFGIRGRLGRTALQTAMQRLDLDLNTMKLILESSEMEIDQPDDDGTTLLHLALIFGRRRQTIKSLLKLGASINTKDNKGNTALHFAVIGGKRNIIKYLISQGSDVTEVNNDGDTPLHFLKSTQGKNYFQITKVLLDNKADLYSKNKLDQTMAHEICVTDNMTCDDFKVWVTAMIKSGHADLFTRRGQMGRTPLQNCMERLDLDFRTMKLIIESAKLDINQPDDFGLTILHLALRFGRSLNTIKTLIELGANWKSNVMFDCSVMHSAVIGSNQEAFLYFKSLGADPNATDEYGSTPLHLVVGTKSKDYFGMTKFLQDNGANLYSRNKYDKTVAHEMSSFKKVSSNDFKVWATAMIKSGHAHLFTIRGYLGRTPLHAAIERFDFDLETMKSIVESARLDINQTDETGETILHLALSFGRTLDTIKSLVELDADWKRTGMDDCSIMHYAVREGNKEAFLYFKSLGADVNATNVYGETPLHFVRWTRNKDYLGMTKFVLKNGARLDAKDNDGNTLAHFMSPDEDLSVEAYGDWREGMIHLIQLGHASFFLQE